MARASASQSARLIVLVAAVLCAFIGLGARLFDLHIAQRDFLQHEGKARILRTLPIVANRGLITDRNGVILAISSPIDSFWVNPQDVDVTDPKWFQACQILQIDCSTFLKRLTETSRDFVYFKRQVLPGVVQQIDALHLSGLHKTREMRRFYPESELVSQVVGTTNIDGEGLEGIELHLNQMLKGEHGRQQIIKDALGHRVRTIAEMLPSKPGEDVQLSIDMRLQYLAYKELKDVVIAHGAKQASVILVDNRTGEVLVMANYPSFNPNQPSVSQPHRRNAAVTDTLEPGSVLKTFSTVTILESGKFSPESVVDTHPGWIRVGRHVVKDHRDYGKLDLAGVLQKSSNVGISKFILDLPPTSLYTTLQKFGFGQPTGIQFPGEQAGRLEVPTRIAPFALATTAFGYGLMATPLQLTGAYATIANNGLRITPTLIKKSNNQLAPGERVISRETAKTMQHLLQTVVHDGTGARGAQVSGYHVAGKTGTVRKVGAHGYEHRYRALFAGFAPAEDPRLTMVVIVDDPQGAAYYGGQIAAPVFGRLMAASLRILSIPPADGAAAETVLANYP